MKTFVFLGIFFVCCQSTKLPSYLTKCNKNDKKLNECLTTTANAAWPIIVQGDPTYHIQKLNPFYVPFMRIEVSDALKGNVTDVTISGLEEAQFTDIKFDLNKKTLDIKFSTPRLNFKANYEVSGQLLFLPLEGQGPANITFLDMVNNLHLEYSLKKKAGKEFIEVTKTEMKYDTSRAHFRLDNLFGGDERLGTAMNLVLDESWEAVNEEVGARLANAIGLTFSTLLQSFFRKVPLEDLFDD